MAEASPGVFTVDGNFAAALNEDGTVNSFTNPAKLGSIVSVFATGLGPISPAQADGSLVGLPLPVNTLPVAAQYPCFPCETPFAYDVLYAGPAPFLIAGASQINFRMTSDIAVLVVKTASGSVVSNSFSIF